MNEPSYADDPRFTNRTFLDDLWRWKCGLPPKSNTFEEFCGEQWSPEFERLMRNRLILGALRYGPLNAPGKPRPHQGNHQAARRR